MGGFSEEVVGSQAGSLRATCPPRQGVGGVPRRRQRHLGLELHQLVAPRLEVRAQDVLHALRQRLALLGRAAARARAVVARMCQRLRAVGSYAPALALRVLQAAVGGPIAFREGSGPQRDGIAGVTQRHAPPSPAMRALTRCGVVLCGPSSQPAPVARDFSSVCWRDSSSSMEAVCRPETPQSMLELDMGRGGEGRGPGPRRSRPSRGGVGW